MTRSELYKLTLRDTTFTLDRSQIEFDSPNYFTSCFLGSFSESHAREIRLSRDPALFSIIVNYLSGYAILPVQPPVGMSDQAAVENLLRDALFYGLDELAAMLEEHKSEKKAPMMPEERVVKSYVMIVWPPQRTFYGPAFRESSSSPVQFTFSISRYRSNAAIDRYHIGQSTAQRAKDNSSLVDLGCILDDHEIDKQPHDGSKSR
ncbi:hypothetical protein RSOL_352460, partial [Rhizoctonia solani AG-3 Rhs1AP]